MRRSNTILYSDRWTEMVAFYRGVLALRVEFENDWFVEFAVGPDAFVSIANAARSTIPSGTGAGLTLSWRVADVYEVRSDLLRLGVDVGEVGTRWGAEVVDVFDPAGNRLEFWNHTVTSSID